MRMPVMPLPPCSHGQHNISLLSDCDSREKDLLNTRVKMEASSDIRSFLSLQSCTHFMNFTFCIFLHFTHSFIVRCIHAIFCTFFTVQCTATTLILVCSAWLNALWSQPGEDSAAWKSSNNPEIPTKSLKTTLNIAFTFFSDQEYLGLRMFPF